MKVEGSKLAEVAAGGAPRAADAGADVGLRKSALGRAGASDRMELSRPAARLGTWLSDEAGARAERVSSLGRDVQAGRYQPNASHTSRALIAETLGATADDKAGDARK